MTRQKQTADSEPLSRREKFLRRGLPAIGAGVLGAAALTKLFTGIAEANTDDAERKAWDAYVLALQKTAVTTASVDSIIGTPMQDLGNGESPRIYAQAMAQLEALGLDDEENINATSVDITSKAISSTNLIHPDSIFVLTRGDFDGNPDTIEVAVQVAPEEYAIEDTQLSNE